MTTPKKILEVGWREWIGLPEIGIGALKAKIDTGARTSALHAIDLEPFTRDGQGWISFRVPLPGSAGKERRSAPLIGTRAIKNTGGIPEVRQVVRSMLQIGNRRWHIEVSLADRQNMEFEMILGRTALGGHNVIVHPDRSFLIPASGGHVVGTGFDESLRSSQRNMKCRPIADLTMMRKK